MKLTALFLLAGGLMSGQTLTNPMTSHPVAHKQSIQPLTSAEKKELATARDKVAKAQAELEQAENKVKYAHGYSPARANFCDQSETLVEFWGDYALVETNPVSSCQVTW